MRVQDEKVRNIYIEEATKSGWSVCQLQRQINTMYYQRMLASQDRQSVAVEIEMLCQKWKIRKLLKKSDTSKMVVGILSTPHSGVSEMMVVC